MADKEDMRRIKKKKDIYCGNCGKKGHIYKKCHFPIISLGVICLKYKNVDFNKIIEVANSVVKKKITSIEINSIYETIKDITEKDIEENLKFLLIRRRNSLSIVEFLRGKYNINDIEYLYNTFSLMTNKEREEVVEDDFDYLWSNLWDINNQTKTHLNEYEISKLKFYQLKKGLEVTVCNIPVIISLSDIIKNTSTNWCEPEWGFPKGRRNLKEKDLNCAIREFEEETSFNKVDYNILDIEPLTEIFMGTNNIKYKHTYYVAQSCSDIIPMINMDNINQRTEVGAIGWYSYNESNKLIREYNIDKKNVLRNLYSIIKLLILQSKELFRNFIKKTDQEQYQYY